VAQVTIRACLCILGGYLAAQSPAHAEIIWSQSFETGSAPEFSNPRFATTPIGHRRFLGQYSNDATSLTLRDLLPGTYRLEFDFFGIGTWDGSETPGPDWFVVSSGEAGELIRTTFAIGSEDTRIGWQAYPYLRGEALLAAPGRTGALENNTLGYLVENRYQRDAVWRLATEFDVVASTQCITFRGEGLQGLADESWGLDNMVLFTVPSPGVLGVFAGLGLLRRRRG
jgi:hypothetical protein